MKISVYITSYNQKRYLEDAINSVLTQELQPFEIIIVDDFSTDGSRDLIISYARKYKLIKYYFHDRNMGVSHTRVTALNHVQGDYVTYVDGDDILLPHKLKTEAELLIKTNSDLVFSNNEYVTEENIDEVKWVWMANDLKINDQTNLFVKTITRDFPKGALFRMELVKYSLMKKVGFHDTELKLYEDYDLRIRLAKHAKIAYSQSITAKIRISKAGLSKMRTKEHLDAFKYIFKKYKEDINSLEPKDRKFVNRKLDDLIASLKPKNKKLSFDKIWLRLKRKTLYYLRISV